MEELIPSDSDHSICIFFCLLIQLLVRPQMTMNVTIIWSYRVCSNMVMEASLSSKLCYKLIWNQRSLITAIAVRRQNHTMIYWFSGEKCPKWDSAHWQDDVNPHILYMFDGTFWFTRSKWNYSGQVTHTQPLPKVRACEYTKQRLLATL